MTSESLGNSFVSWCERCNPTEGSDVGAEPYDYGHRARVWCGTKGLDYQSSRVSRSAKVKSYILIAIL